MTYENTFKENNLISWITDPPIVFLFRLSEKKKNKNLKKNLPLIRRKETHNKNNNQN